MNTPDNPQVRIDEELIVACAIKYSIDDWGIIGSADHPAFAELRRVLESRGLIESPPYACVNGDRVLQPFRFNDFQLTAGDKFYCAAAWAVKLRGDR